MACLLVLGLLGLLAWACGVRLAADVGRQVSDQELFMSDVEDDNALSAIDALCPILADFLVDDLDDWLHSRSRLPPRATCVPQSPSRQAT